MAGTWYWQLTGTEGQGWTLNTTGQQVQLDTTKHQWAAGTIKQYWGPLPDSRYWAQSTGKQAVGTTRQNRAPPSTTKQQASLGILAGQQTLQAADITGNQIGS